MCLLTTIFENQQTLISNVAEQFSKFDRSNPGKSIEHALELSVSQQKDYLDAAQQVQDALTQWSEVSWKHLESFISEQANTLQKAGHAEAAAFVEQVKSNVAKGKTQIDAGKKVVENVISKAASVAVPKKRSAK